MDLKKFQIVSVSKVCLIAISLCTACGSNDNNGFFGGGGITDVDEIDVDDSVVGLGEGTVVRVNFSFDNNDVFNDEGNVRLVVKLPRGLRYRPDSAEIDEAGSGDENIGAQTLECSQSGETYLLFDMDRFDLRNAQVPSGGSDAQLKLTVDGTRRGSTLVIEAKADEDRVVYGCDQTFVPEEQEVVSVI